MNLKQKPKLELIIGSLNEKYSENTNYFVSFSFDVFSGTKKYSGTIKPQNDIIILSFMGEKECTNFEKALSELCSLIIKYDRATVYYEERGLITEISADDKNVRISKSEKNEDLKPTTNLKNKEYNISLHKAKQLLNILGFTTEDGKLKNDMIRKYNQTDRFIELVGDMFDGMTDITIVDCACGKSYLSFVLNYWLWQEKRIKARFIGLDISEKVISESKKMAETLGYSNMEFIQADLSDINSFSVGGIQPDAVISLHACDVATDMAMGYAIRNGAKNIICVPCCHKELLEQIKNDDIEPLLKHGLFRARFNDLITDSIRSLKLEASGYSVSCVEYCSPLDTPKNLLIKAKKMTHLNAKAEAEYRKILKDFSLTPSIEKYSQKT